jgi:hypothetical protein
VQQAPQRERVQVAADLPMAPLPVLDPLFD